MFFLVALIVWTAIAIAIVTVINFGQKGKK